MFVLITNFVLEPAFDGINARKEDKVEDERLFDVVDAEDDAHDSDEEDIKSELEHGDEDIHEARKDYCKHEYPINNGHLTDLGDEDEVEHR